ncbi:MAG TPA: TetR family transcriptional regulator [Acidimicrobiia bacterium]
MAVQESTTGLRERKKQATRDQLVAAAFELFTERGFDNVSVAEIATAVGVSERTFFRYFAAKEDVLFPDAGEKHSHVQQLLIDLPPELSLVDGMRRALVALSAEYEESKAMMLQRAQLVAGAPSLRVHVLQREQEWVEEFGAAIAARMDLDQADDMRPELAAAMIVTAFRVVLSRWLRSGGEDDMPMMLDQALAFIGSGLGADDI